MPKVEIPDSKYAVSFNVEIDEYAVGDSYMDTIDYIGDDIEELAEEVITDLSRLLVSFVRVDHDVVVGVFVEGDEDEDCPSLIMYRR